MPAELRDSDVRDPHVVVRQAIAALGAGSEVPDSQRPVEASGDGDRLIVELSKCHGDHVAVVAHKRFAVLGA
jgi:hypothetical protein